MLSEQELEKDTEYNKLKEEFYETQKAISSANVSRKELTHKLEELKLKMFKRKKELMK